MAPTKTFFNPSAMPNNLLTVQEWKRFAKAVGKRSWEGAARYFAQTSERGGAMVLRANDTLVVFTLRDNGKVEKRSHKPNKWGWANA